MRFSVVVGNPNPGGRTTTTGEAVARKVAGTVGDVELETIELATYAERLFRWEDVELTSIWERVATADLAVFACPTYKASFTGLLKASLDRYGNNGLAGLVAIPVMLGAAPVHALAPEMQLRPVLVELGATLPSRAVFMLDREMDSLDATIDAWWELAERPLRSALRLPGE